MKAWIIYESQDSGIYRTVPDRTTDAAEKSAQWAHSQSVNFNDGLRDAKLDVRVCLGSASVT